MTNSSNCTGTRAAQRFGGAIMIAALMLAACGGGSSNSTTAPNPNPNPNTQTVAITVVSRSLDSQADAGQLYTYVGDAPISRAQMATLVNENAPTVRYTPGSSQGSATLQVPRGKVVTVFAVEFNTNGSAVDQTNTPIPTSAPRSEVEFISFEGPATLVETGVVAVTADANKTVTANFDRVTSVVFQIIGCIDYRIQNTNTAGLLSHGRIISDPAPDLTSFNGFGGVLGGTLDVQRNYLLLWGKQGSIITMRARTRENRPAMQSGFIRWDGAAATCGTNLLCQLPVPLRSNSSGAFQMINGWTLTNATTLGCGCVVGTNCVMLP